MVDVLGVGHLGLELAAKSPPDGYTFLLPPDIDALANPGPGDAIGLDEVGQHLKGSATNLLLYAGCREDLMPHEAAQAVRNRRLR